MKKKPIKFAAIGECMLELRHVNKQLLAISFAGDTFNVALYLARYRAKLNIEIDYVTALGNDPYSKMMLKAWQQEGIKTNLTQTIPNSLPGIYLIRTNAKGERSFYYYRSQSAARKIFSAPTILFITKKLIQYDHLYFSGITLAILDPKSRNRLFTLLKQARQKGAKISFDSNYRAILWKNKSVAKKNFQRALQLSDTALVTFEDEKKLFGDKNPEECAKRLYRQGVPEVVIKLGANGSLVSTPQKQTLIRAEKVSKIVDTTAAGDSFNAAYLGARIKGFPPIAAAKAGQKLAAKVIQYPGAIIPKKAMPNIFVHAKMQRRKRRKEEK